MTPIDSASPSPKAPKVSSANLTSQPQTVSLLKQTTPRKHRGFKIFLGIMLLAMVLLGGIVVSRAVNLSDKIFVGKKTTFIGKILDVLRSNSGDTVVEGEDLGQINILLLGIGGEGHDGPYLSDTMILAQIRPDTGQAVLTSIPRDYLVNLPNNLGARKINAAFAEGFARNKNWDEAGQWARQVVEQMSGLTIPYFAVVDFSGFEKAINQVGGVDITIDRTFTDYSFPNDATAGYLPPVTFKEGTEHMDGTRALIFARSRHAAGPEGSDFARSQRQQKVIAALKKKVLDLNLVSDLSTINKLVGTFADHFHTNMTPGELLRLYKLSKEHNITNFSSTSLDPDSSLICPKILEDNGAYVLVPCEGKTKEDVKNFFKNAFAIGSLREEGATVWLSSSTHNRYTYNQADTLLRDAGLTVWELPYKGPELDQNTFYTVNPKPATIEYLKNTLQAQESYVAPEGIKIDKSKVDIVLILGGDKDVTPPPGYYTGTSTTAN